MKYWLIKSEGDCYSIDDLKRDGKTSWEGVRNYRARNYMRDEMGIGDLALFYHSNGTASEPTGVYGIAKVVSKSHPDLSAFRRGGEHFDPKSTKAKPSWYCVDFSFVKKLKKPISLSQIKGDAHLCRMLVAQKGQRLSIMPVDIKDFERVVRLSDA